MSKILKAAIARTDKYASIYIRLRDADQNGYASCCCCGDRYFWEKDRIVNGHFVPKGIGATAVRWLLQNQNSQCNICNTSPNKRMKGGIYTTPKSDVAQIEYTRFMQKRYGNEIIDDLKVRKFQTIHYSLEDIQEIGTLYKELGEIERRNKGL